MKSIISYIYVICGQMEILIDHSVWSKNDAWEIPGVIFNLPFVQSSAALLRLCVCVWVGRWVWVWGHHREMTRLLVGLNWQVAAVHHFEVRGQEYRQTYAHTHTRIVLLPLPHFWIEVLNRTDSWHWRKGVTKVCSEFTWPLKFFFLSLSISPRRSRCRLLVASWMFSTAQETELGHIQPRFPS